MTRLPVLILTPGAAVAGALPPPLPLSETFGADVTCALASMLLALKRLAAGWLARRRSTLVAALRPFAAGAVAWKRWMASLLMGWLVISPSTAGRPPAWARARRLPRLMARADAESGA